MRVRMILPLLATLVAIAGCSNGKPTSTVNGTVKLNGKPQNVGSVNFLSKSGAAALAELDENGNFKVETPIEATEYKVYLGAPIPGQLAPGTKPSTPAAKFNVLPKHLDPQQSSVTITLKPGANDGVEIVFKD